MDLQWHDYYALGDAQLDDDHKALLRVMEQVRGAVAAADRAGCVSLLDVLMDKAAEHFSREEELLAALGWQGLPEHVSYHGELLLKAEFLRALCERAAEPAEIEEHFCAIAEFLVDDLLRGDLEFKPFLEEKLSAQAI